MTNEGIVALGLLGAVAVAAVAADRRRRRPGSQEAPPAGDAPAARPPPAVEDTIGLIDYASPTDEDGVAPEDDPLD